MATGLNSLESWLQPAAHQLVSIASQAGLYPRVSSARRTHAQQALLYRRFLAGQSRFPAAPPGHSSHELGLAFDLWVNDESQLSDLGQVWEQMGGVWGGHFHDPIHFEAGGIIAQGARQTQKRVRAAPRTSQNPFLRLADFLSGFVPVLGQVQTAEEIAAILDGRQDVASWYLQHPAEALRDLIL
jgi:hypothetical protein